MVVRGYFQSVIFVQNDLTAGKVEDDDAVQKINKEEELTKISAN